MERLVEDADAIRDAIARSVTRNLKTMARMGVFLEREVQKQYPEFPVRSGVHRWEEYLPTLSPESGTAARKRMKARRSRPPRINRPSYDARRREMFCWLRLRSLVKVFLRSSFRARRVIPLRLHPRTEGFASLGMTAFCFYRRLFSAGGYQPGVSLTAEQTVQFSMNFHGIHPLRTYIASCRRSSGSRRNRARLAIVGQQRAGDLLRPESNLLASCLRAVRPCERGPLRRWWPQIASDGPRSISRFWRKGLSPSRCMPVRLPAEFARDDARCWASD